VQATTPEFSSTHGERLELTLPPKSRLPHPSLDTGTILLICCDESWLSRTAPGVADSSLRAVPRSVLQKLGEKVANDAAGDMVEQRARPKAPRARIRERRRMNRHEHRGGCHCGNLRWTLHSDLSLAQLPVRT
jgi:hypothetical protein